VISKIIPGVIPPDPRFQGEGKEGGRKGRGWEDKKGRDWKDRGRGEGNGVREGKGKGQKKKKGRGGTFGPP
jgi:hypothetical protein